MSVATPTMRNKTGETGIRLGAPWVAILDPDPATDRVRLVIATTDPPQSAAAADVLVDTRLRPYDDGESTDVQVEVQLAKVGAQPSTTYYAAATKGDGSGLSSWSSSISLTTEAAALTATRWTRGQ